jgi:hypothetical protein
VKEFNHLAPRILVWIYPLKFLKRFIIFCLWKRSLTCCNSLGEVPTAACESFCQFRRIGRGKAGSDITGANTDLSTIIESTNPPLRQSPIAPLNIANFGATVFDN